MLLKGRVIANNGRVIITELGSEDHETLVCVTDSLQCCSSSTDGIEISIGEWYFPNGSAIDTIHSGNDMYVSRYSGEVHLHRRRDVQTPTGMFHCTIPDISGINRNIFAQLITNEATPSPTPAGLSTVVILTVAVLAAVLIIMTLLIFVVLGIITRYGRVHAT